MGTWTARNTGLTGTALNVNHIIQHPATKFLPARAHILFIATDGGVFKSLTGGLNWTQLILPDPSNAEFGDAPAATVDELTFEWVALIQGVVLLVLAAKDSNSRLWLYRSNDTGATGTWTSRGGDDRMSFTITHESNDLSEYTGTILAGTGTVATSAASAMAGTSYGLESTNSAAGDRSVAYKDFVAFGNDGYIIRLWFDPNSFTQPAVNPTNWSSTDCTIFRLTNIAGGTGAFFIFIEMQWNGSSYVIRCCISDDSLVAQCTGDILINNTSQVFQIIVRKAATAVSNDGSLEFYVNGVLSDTISNLDLFTRYGLADRIQIGIDDTLGEPGQSGTCYYDEIFGEDFTGANPEATDGKLKAPSNFIDALGGGAAGGAGGGAGGNMADVSSDNLFVYIASFNDLGFPALIKISAAANADGTVVFEPGAGGRIGVICGKYNEDYVWVAGQFDGTNTVEKSEDAGTSFTVKDDGTFGAIRSFEVGPDTDDRVIIFDGDNGDIIETVDDGTTWTAINAAVTPLVNTIARFVENLTEVVFGNQGAANNSINYSPNSGANLEDYQTGVYPADDATKVIAN